MSQPPPPPPAVAYPFEHKNRCSLNDDCAPPSAVGQPKRKREIGGSIPGVYPTLGERMRHGPNPCTAPRGEVAPGIELLCTPML